MEPPLNHINAVTNVIIEYLKSNPNVLETPGIFRETGEPLAIATAMAALSNEPNLIAFEALGADFLNSPHNIASLYKMYLKCATANIISDESISSLIHDYQSIVLSGNMTDKAEHHYGYLIQHLISQNHLSVAHFLYQHAQLCLLVAKYESSNNMNLSNAVMVLCDMAFQDFVFGRISPDVQLKFNIALQKNILQALQDTATCDFSKPWFDQTERAAPKEKETNRPSEPIEEPIAEEDIRKESYEEIDVIKEGKADVSVEEGERAEQIDNDNQQTQDQQADLQHAMVDEVSLSKEQPSSSSHDSPDAPASAFSMVGGLLKNAKQMAQKTIDDLTKKSSDKPAQSASPQVKKAPVDYKSEALKTFKKSKRVMHEMVSLAFNKEITLETDQYAAPVKEVPEFEAQIHILKEHLSTYQQAKEQENKQDMATSKQVCRQDKPMINELINDVEQELQSIYFGFQAGEPMDTLNSRLSVVMEKKWRALSKVKEMNEGDVICPNDEFDSKFEGILSLHAAIRQAIQSMISNDSAPEDE